MADRTGAAKFTDNGSSRMHWPIISGNFNTPAQADTAPAQDQRIQNRLQTAVHDTVLPIMGTDGEDDLSGTAVKA